MCFLLICYSCLVLIVCLGGPGAGKGTLCSQLAGKFGYAHYSAGDLLRAAAKSDTEQGKMLSQMMADGKIVPSEITIGLLKKSIEETTETDTFLIDGFPRSISQGQEFEDSITKCKFVLFLDAPQDIMEQRIMKRAGETRGPKRNDDNLASLQKVRRPRIMGKEVG